MDKLIVIDKQEYELRLDIERAMRIEERLGKPFLECEYGMSMSDLMACLFYISGAHHKTNFEKFVEALMKSKTKHADLVKKVDSAFVEFLKGIPGDKPEVPEKKKSVEEKKDEEWRETESGDLIVPGTDLLVSKEGHLLAKT